MTREEEIKARLAACDGVTYDYGRAGADAKEDMIHLLARNEELQREKEKMQSVVDAAREHKKFANRKQGAFQWLCECPVCIALNALDAKEQDDAQAD